MVADFSGDGASHHAKAKQLQRRHRVCPRSIDRCYVLFGFLAGQFRRNLSPAPSGRSNAAEHARYGSQVCDRWRGTRFDIMPPSQARLIPADLGAIRKRRRLHAV